MRLRTVHCYYYADHTDGGDDTMNDKGRITHPGIGG